MKPVIIISSPSGFRVTYLFLSEKDLRSKTLHQLGHKNRLKQIIYGGAFTYYHKEMDFTYALSKGFKIIIDNRGKF